MVATYDLGSEVGWIVSIMAKPRVAYSASRYAFVCQADHLYHCTDRQCYGRFGPHAPNTIINTIAPNNTMNAQ